MSRYKLLGEVWDSCKTKAIKTKQNIDLSNIMYYNIDKNLDYKMVKINLSEILSTSQQGLLKIINQLNKYKTVYIEIDNMPKVKNEIVQAFFEKRLKQINYVLSSSLSDKTKIAFIDKG